jgi:tetratricopeptide (TPR) repeat protein
MHEGPVFPLTSLQVLPLPRSRFWPVPGKQKQAGLPLDTGFEFLGGTGENGNYETVFNGFFGRRYLDKIKKDFYVGARCLQEEDPYGAAVAFRQITERDESQADAFFALAMCSRDAQEQLEAVDRALVMRKNFTKLSRETGIGFCATFLACDHKRVRVMNDFPGLEILASEIYQKHGKLDDAWRLLESSQHADLELFRFSRGDLLIRLQRYEEAIDALKRLNANPQLAGPAYYLMGLALEKLGYCTTAVQVYRGCLKSEVISLRLEAAIRKQMVSLLEREEKQWLAKRERERLAALEVKLKAEKQ